MAKTEGRTEPARRVRKQAQIWNKGEELPLFTGTAMKARDEVFRPPVVNRQSRLFGPLTFDELARARRKRKK